MIELFLMAVPPPVPTNDVPVDPGPYPIHDVRFAWDPSPSPPESVSGYVMHYGTTMGIYTNHVGFPSTNGVLPLPVGPTNYIAVTAIGTNQLESEFSEEISVQTYYGWRVILHATNPPPGFYTNAVIYKERFLRYHDDN